MKNNTIGKRIAEARINRNITQEHLEELSGLSVSTISRIETSLKESSKKIAVFFLFVVILVVSIGTLMYMIEGTQPGTQFSNIPNELYRMLDEAREGKE